MRRDSNIAAIVQVDLKGACHVSFNFAVRFTAQARGVAGSLRVEGAAAYWIDSGGDKLIYKNKPCVNNGVNKCVAPVGLTEK